MDTQERAPESTVAWARMFAEVDKNDLLSAENNVLRGDRDGFRRAFSYFAGYSRGLGKQAIGRGERRRLARDVAALGPLIDEIEFGKGWRAGQAIELREDRAERTREGNRWAKVARRHGCNSPEELDRRLSEAGTVGPS